MSVTEKKQPVLAERVGGMLRGLPRWQRVAYLLALLLSGFYIMLVITMTRCTPPIWLLTLGTACIAALLLWAAARYGARVFLPRRAQRDKLCWKVFALGTLFCALVMYAYQIAHWPGGLSSDSLEQWTQVVQGRFSDWNPALHTLLIALLAKIVPHPAFVIAVQLLLYSLLVGYIGAQMQAWGMPRWVFLGTIAYLTLLPPIGNTMVFLWKDCAFSLAMLWMFSQLTEVYFSDGQWLKRPLHIFTLALSAVLASILRHNGVLGAIPAMLVFALIMRRHWKAVCATLLCACALFAGIKGPLYSAVHVEQRTSAGVLKDVCGLPMAIMGNVFIHSADRLPPDIYDYMVACAPAEVWNKHYALGDWYEMKDRTDTDAVLSVSIPTMALYAARAWRADPVSAYAALGRFCSTVMQPFTRADWRLSPFVEEGRYPFGFKRTGVPILYRLFNGIVRHTGSPLLAFLLWNLGTLMLITMILMALRFPYTGARGWALAVPMLTYTFGTLAGLMETVNFRYFFADVLVFPLVLMSLLAVMPRPASLKAEE